MRSLRAGKPEREADELIYLLKQIGTTSLPSHCRSSLVGDVGAEQHHISPGLQVSLLPCCRAGQAAPMPSVPSTLCPVELSRAPLQEGIRSPCVCRACAGGKQGSHPPAASLPFSGAKCILKRRKARREWPFIIHERGSQRQLAPSVFAYILL